MLMKIAYLILAHTQIEQLYQLIESLDDKDSIFFIHIDRKYKGNLNTYFKKNVLFSKRRVYIHWGGYSIVTATMHLMDLAINSLFQADYFILLSGQCFPIKRKNELGIYLEQNHDKLFIECRPFPLEEQKGGGWPKIQHHWFMDELAPLNSYLKWGFLRSLHYFQNVIGFRRRYPAGIQPFWGSQWWALPRFAVEYVLENVRKRPDLLRFHRFSFCPDELYIQTVIGNSPYYKQISNKPFRYIDWEHAEKSGSPKTLRMEDFETLKNSEHYFARKFDMTVDAEIIKKFDALK